MFNKLKKRIKSLEEFIGVRYSPDKEYPEHLNADYGDFKILQEDLKELNKEVEKLKTEIYGKDKS